MPNSTSPKPSFDARKKACEKKLLDDRTADIKKPERSPEVLAEIERFFETGIGAKDNSRPCHLI